MKRRLYERGDGMNLLRFCNLPLFYFYISINLKYIRSFYDVFIFFFCFFKLKSSFEMIILLTYIRASCHVWISITELQNENLDRFQPHITKIIIQKDYPFPYPTSKSWKIHNFPSCFLGNIRPQLVPLKNWKRRASKFSPLYLLNKYKNLTKKANTCKDNLCHDGLCHCNTFLVCLGNISKFPSHPYLILLILIHQTSSSRKHFGIKFTCKSHRIE